MSGANSCGDCSERYETWKTPGNNDVCMSMSVGVHTVVWNVRENTSPQLEMLIYGLTRLDGQLAGFKKKSEKPWYLLGQLTFRSPKLDIDICRLQYLSGPRNHDICMASVSLQQPRYHCDLNNMVIVKSLQSHFILTMSHWSNGLTLSFSPQGTWVQIPWGILMWNRDSPVSVVSLHYTLHVVVIAGEISSL
jgi:hypothetical protein